MNANLVFKEAQKIFSMFCLPRIIIKDGKVDIQYVWKSEDAENAYNNLVEIGNHFDEIQKRYNASTATFQAKSGT